MFLKGVDKEEPEGLTFGHKFPEESRDLDELFDRFLADAPDYFIKEGKTILIPPR
ncbi:hypothetical protein ACFFH4_18615 [Halalkalibacter alkalisediminis]|uniref:Uncharacterized protein n=1 Tax=Halalkalibacter alkalisediminis TaxID=935616 RepID=A0ABV6NL50_9BACI